MYNAAMYNNMHIIHNTIIDVQLKVSNLQAEVKGLVAAKAAADAAAAAAAAAPPPPAAPVLPDADALAIAVSMATKQQFDTLTHRVAELEMARSTTAQAKTVAQLQSEVQRMALQHQHMPDAMTAAASGVVCPLTDALTARITALEDAVAAAGASTAAATAAATASAVAAVDSAIKEVAQLRERVALMDETVRSTSALSIASSINATTPLIEGVSQRMSQRMSQLEAKTDDVDTSICGQVEALKQSMTRMAATIADLMMKHGGIVSVPEKKGDADADADVDVVGAQGDDEVAKLASLSKLDEVEHPIEVLWGKQEGKQEEVEREETAEAKQAEAAESAESAESADATVPQPPAAPKKRSSRPRASAKKKQ